MIGAFLFAATLNLGSLPPVEHLDCEVSTNVVLATSPDMSEMEFTLSLFSTSSNVVEVAFGTDTDLDGDISRKETELIVGCECGVWQIVDPKNGNKYIYGESSGDSEFKWSAWMPAGRDSKRLRAKLNGNEAVTQIPRDTVFFKRAWTHCKIVSRGSGVCFGSLNINQSLGRFYIIVR
jgi:hypothetical protein